MPDWLETTLFILVLLVIAACLGDDGSNHYVI